MFQSFVKFSIFICLFFLVSLTQQSCVYEVQTPNVCFQEDILPIFVSKCALSACHDPVTKKEGYDFSNYEGIMRGIEAGHPQKSEVHEQIAFGQMPPKGSLSLTKLEKNQIKNWIRLGAPNNSNCKPCDTTFTYKDRIRPLLDKWCVGCHQGIVAGGGYDLSTYTNVKLTVSNGKLLGSIKHSNGFKAMPQNSAKLSDCDIKAVEDWISAGALE